MRTLAVGKEEIYGSGLQGGQNYHKIHYHNFSYSMDKNREKSTSIGYLVPTVGYDTTHVYTVDLTTTLRLEQSLPFFASFFGSEFSYGSTNVFELNLTEYIPKFLTIFSAYEDIGGGKDGVALHGCVVNNLDLSCEVNEFCNLDLEIFARCHEKINVASFSDYKNDIPVSFTDIELSFSKDPKIYNATNLNLSCNRGIKVDEEFIVGSNYKDRVEQSEPVEITGNLELLRASKANNYNPFGDDDEITIDIKMMSNSYEMDIELERVYINKYDYDVEYGDNLISIEFENLGDMSITITKK